MADVLLIRSSCGFRIFCTSRCRVWRNIRHLRTLTGYTGQPLVKIRSGHNLLGITKTCSSCVRVNRLSSQAEVVLSSQVAATESSTQLEKSKKYQLLHVMPFSVMQGGKYVAHVLLKHKPNRAIVFVRTKVLAVELMRELAEYGLECLSPERVDKTEATDEEKSEQQEKDALEENSERLEPNQRITVVTEGEVAAMESLLPADLILLVQQPMTGKSFALFCLKKTHAKVRPLDVMLLYSHNDLAFLSQLKTHVDIKKLPPPSFHNVPMMTEGLPSLPGESVVIPGRHLIEPPPPAITATIPPKVPRSILFQPSIPVPVKQSERHRLKDQCRIYVRGGSGGQGSCSFGGMGGDGGDVVVQSFPDVTLDHFSVKENRRILAEHGTYFSGKRGKRRKGFRGRDTIIPVPIGTSVCTDDGQIMAELDEVGSRVVVAKGGRGGSPAMENWRGEKGERAMIRLEMRLIADVALVGFPNAGKSSLLSAISKATPKTADYAFTTMRPNIGIVEYSDHSQVSVADLPGLIEGASANRGLGHSFLKHTQKASSLALVVDIDGFHLSDKFPARTALQNVFILLQELVLYDKELLNRPKMLIVTKLDKKGATSRFQELRQSIQSIQHGTVLPVLQEIHSSSPVVQDDTDLMDLSDELDRIRFDSIIPVSAVTSFGLDDLRDKIKALL